MENTEKQDKIVALNGDVVGYSQLVADDLESTTAAMIAYRQLVNLKVSENSGTLIDFIGDNFMAVFEDGKAAVQSAIGIATEVENKNAALPNTRQIRFRMGVDAGKATIAEGRYVGEPLNIAARIQTLAQPGGLCISGNVYRELDEPALRFRSIGQQQLKNIAQEVDVYEFADLPGDGASTTGRRRLSLESPTVAVLPIHTEQVEESVVAMAGILRSDLIHRLTRVPQLNVVDANVDIRQNRAATAARYMLETGIQQFGEKTRLYATLFDVTTMNIVKSYKWIVTAGDLFDLSERFVDDVARSIEIELIVGEPAGLYMELNDPHAIENVYTGWYHLRSDTQQGWTYALERFGQVARSHPDQPYGHVLLAFANWIGAANEWAPDTGAAISKARALAKTAIRVGDPTGMARAVEASILMVEGRHEEALAVVEELGILRPTCDVTYGLEGSVRRYLGQWERSVELLDTAMRLTGINKPWYPTVKSCSLFVGGRIDQAASLAEMVLAYQPNNLEALLVLAAAQVEMGLIHRANATVNIIQKRFPSVDMQAWLDNKPYQISEQIERWKKDLANAGAVARG